MFGAIGAAASAMHSSRQQAAHARQMYEMQQYRNAMREAVRSGTCEVVQHKGRWLACVLGESRIPKVKRSTTS